MAKQKSKSRKTKAPSAKRYSMKMKNVIKKLYVEDGMTAKGISNLKKEYPSHQTITIWATKKNRIGLSWRDEREQRRIDHYNSIAPQAMVSKALGKIDWLLSKENLETKDFDALSKIQKFLREITDWRYHAPMIFQAVTRYLDFVDKNYPELIKGLKFTDASQKFMVVTTGIFMNSLTHFKNELIKELEDVNFKGIH